MTQGLRGGEHFGCAVRPFYLTRTIVTGYGSIGVKLCDV